ncbi:hypothetical protein STEG23_022108 [Scotinomys teguina]
MSPRCSGWLFQLSLEVPPPLMFPVTVTPLGRDQDCSLKNREPDVPAPWFLDPGDWSKTAAVRLYFIFPGICTLSLTRNSLERDFSLTKSIYTSYADLSLQNTSKPSSLKTAPHEPSIHNIR